jgi:branched-chain amino acid transport system permease protein
MEKNINKTKSILMFFLKVVLPLTVVYLFVALNFKSNDIHDASMLDLITNIGINIILAVSLNLINGLTGQFSLGHAGFMLIGCYTLAVGQTTYHLPFIASILLAAVFAGLVGLIVGIPTLRLKGDYLAIATLGLGEIIRIVFTNIDYFGGAAGISGIRNDINWNWTFFITLGSVILMRNFMRSAQGRACIAIKEDEVAAEAMGINLTKYKVMAFVIGAAFAGIAGAFFASNIQAITPNTGGFMKSIDILIIVVLGGLGSLSGSVIAAICLSILNMKLQDLGSMRMIIYSILLIMLMIFKPGGIMGVNEFSWEGLWRLIKSIPSKIKAIPGKIKSIPDNIKEFIRQKRGEDNADS